MADTELDRCTYGTPDRLDALPMPIRTGQPAAFRPTTIPIHDDRDMARDIWWAGRKGRDDGHQCVMSLSARRRNLAAAQPLEKNVMTEQGATDGENALPRVASNRRCKLSGFTPA